MEAYYTDSINLPDEVLFHILNLPILRQDLAKLSLVCKRWGNVIRDVRKKLTAISIKLAPSGNTIYKSLQKLKFLERLSWTRIRRIIFALFQQSRFFASFDSFEESKNSLSAIPSTSAFERTCDR